jgi:hypothetical protein
MEDGHVQLPLAPGQGEQKTLMMDATDLKAHRTATSMGVRKGARPPDWPDQRWHEPLTGR